jgi:hypothetical protein
MRVRWRKQSLPAFWLAGLSLAELLVSNLRCELVVRLIMRETTVPSMAALGLPFDNWRNIPISLIDRGSTLGQVDATSLFHSFIQLGFLRSSNLSPMLTLSGSDSGPSCR